MRIAEDPLFSEPTKRNEFISAAKEGGRTNTQIFHSEKITIRHKSYPSTFVTNTDTLSQEIICKRLTKAFPDAVIIAEEDDIVCSPERRIYVDPLDGTLNCINVYDQFAVSIAYWSGGEALAGVVYNPMTEDLVYTFKKKGAYRKSKLINPSSTSRLADCLLATGLPCNRIEYEQDLNTLCRVPLDCQEVRTIGSATLNLCNVATGIFDGYWEWDMDPGDCAGGAATAIEAGCTLSSIDGGPFEIDCGGNSCVK